MFAPRWLLTGIAGAALLARQQPALDFQALLEELPERAALARLPEPAYELRSSSALVRWDEREGRREAVLLDAAGPGVLVRLWLAEPRGTLRLYLGDATRAVLQFPAEELGGARARFPELATSALRLWRLPLPFAARARLTLECEREPVFELAWRAYPADVRVRDFEAAPEAQLRRLGTRWGTAASGPEGRLSYTYSLSQDNPAGEFLCTEPKLCAGPRALSEIVLHVDAPELDSAARALVLHLSFDGEETVVAPLRCFFRALELEPRARGLWSRDYVARWIMPYEKSMELVIENLGPASTHVSGAVYTLPWSWDDRSLHFGARWVGARGASRLALEGRGVLLGIVPVNIPQRFDSLAARVDGLPVALPAALALLDRPLFTKRFEFELPAREIPGPQRLALFYLRPGARIEGRTVEPSDLPSLLADR